MLKVALIGAGVMGNQHSASYKNIKDAKLVAVCDINLEKAKAIADVHGAKAYASYEEMIADAEFDYLDICLPTFLHKEYAIKAMELKKHVFCEKPIANTVEDAVEMTNKANEMNVKLAVGHVVRFFASYKEIEETIKAGRIGNPKLIRTTRNGHFPVREFMDWFGDYELSGGPILDLAIHDLDWIRSAIGEVERVYAKTITHKNIKHVDHCLITLRLKNGCIAHVEASWAYPDGALFATSCEISGTTGQLELDSKNVPIKKYLAGGKTAVGSPLYSERDPYTMEIQNFIDCINNDLTPVVTGEDATETLRLSLAAVESSKTGMPVTL